MLIGETLRVALGALRARLGLAAAVLTVVVAPGPIPAPGAGGTHPEAGPYLESDGTLRRWRGSRSG